jgi:tetratricopeptide (TPR) repeat protein
MGREHPEVAYVLLGLADIALAQDDPTDALRLAQRALAIYRDAEGPTSDLARAQFITARALWAATDDHPRALDLARRAATAYDEAGDAHEEELARVHAWLQGRAPPPPT